MPLLDHFHPPLSVQRVWNTFHHAWAAEIARHLNRYVLPDEFFAAPSVHFGPRVEIDVGTFSESEPTTGGVATLTRTQIPAALATIPFEFPDAVEVAIFSQEGGPELVAAIELVSPANKDRPDTRRAFTSKMSAYLQQGVSLIVIDIVTNRLQNLHHDWLDLRGQTAGRLPDDLTPPLYAVSYRPVRRDEHGAIELWPHALRIGDALPNLPLFLRADLMVELALEETYCETCADQRLSMH